MFKRRMTSVAIALLLAAGITVCGCANNALGDAARTSLGSFITGFVSNVVNDTIVSP